MTKHNDISKEVLKVQETLWVTLITLVSRRVTAYWLDPLREKGTVPLCHSAVTARGGTCTAFINHP